MKKAYLFGAAALLILLIVVAYISSNRQKEGAVCVRPPPQVVGSMAAPVKGPEVRTLTFDDDDDDEAILLPVRDPANRSRISLEPETLEQLEVVRDDALLWITPDQEERLRRLRDPFDAEGTPLLFAPSSKEDFEDLLAFRPSGTELMLPPLSDEELLGLNFSTNRTPIGGPLPVSPWFGPDACQYVPISPSPFSPFTPAREPEVVSSNDSKLDIPIKDTSISDADFDDAVNSSRRAYAKRSVRFWEDIHQNELDVQRAYMLSLPQDSTLRAKFFKEEIRAAQLDQTQRLLDQFGEPIDVPSGDDLFNSFLNSI